jgi:hypothetical protein
MSATPPIATELCHVVERREERRPSQMRHWVQLPARSV